MLSLGKMHSRAKSRSCENYLSIKVQALNTASLLSYFDVLLFVVSCVCLQFYVFPFSGSVVCVFVNIKLMDVFVSTCRQVIF